MRTSTSEFQQEHRHAGRIREVAPLILLVALALIFGPCAANAQVLYGSLTGNVVDPSNAPIPGVKVAALNAGTGVNGQHHR